jgi:aminoglycoside phosphotransferase (APT) family kinase protein
VFAWEEGRALRLMRDVPFARERVALEAAAMRAASGAGAPVPAAFEAVTIDGRPGLVVERVDGVDLLTRLGSRPWTVLSAARLLGSIHAQLHEVSAPRDLPTLKGWIEGRIRESDLVPPEHEHAALHDLDALPDGDRLCHGDFHPGNVLLSAEGPVVIDWTGATRGDPIADVARTRILLRISPPPEGAPRLVRMLEGIGRRLLLSGYLRAYGPLDSELVGRWERVRLVERLAEDVDGERERILAALT